MNFPNLFYVGYRLKPKKSLSVLIFPLFFGISLLFLTGCEELFRDIYYDYKKTKGIKKLRLISYWIEDESMGKEAVVKYPNAYFTEASFIQGLAKEFNSNAYGVEIIAMERKDYTKLQSYYSNSTVTMHPFSVQAKGGLTVKKRLPNKALIYLGRHGGVAEDTAYLSVEITASVWSQKARGYVRIYNHEGRQIWRHELKDFSRYIIYDKGSPYLVKEKYFYIPINPNSTHKGELEKVFSDMGKQAARSLKRILDRIHN